MHRPTTLSATTDTSAPRSMRWSLCVRDDVAELRPASIDELLDFAEVIA
ncbi:hypothetical protein SAMN04488550_1167 [Gordonia malaquae]|nr:hypothetical protein [Gordonia malaquae]SEC01561.1 hypothetical protein SAMN04488550_1167 [Gordonia malaquae]